jgi:hypothetical protein
MTKELECPECYGSGSEYVMRAVRLGEKIVPPNPCPRCGGSGRITDPADPRADFILENAPRLITVAIRCAWSFGASNGLNDILVTPSDPDAPWRQPISVLQRDAMLMAGLRATLLLDSGSTVVSLQEVYHALKETSVQTTLLLALEARHGPDHFTPTRTDLIADFLEAYRAIDWQAYGRLKHLRNLGIAHLVLDQPTKSVTLPELGALVGIVTRLASALQRLVHSDLVFHEDIAEECRDQVRRTVSPPRS